MATLRKRFDVAATPAAAWDAVADFGAPHKRLVPGFVTACDLQDGGAVRAITFANGLQVRERLVTSDASTRRFAYTVEGGRATHYNAVVEVIGAAAGGSTLVWTVDLLPDELAPAIDTMMDAGVAAMEKALG